MVRPKKLLMVEDNDDTRQIHDILLKNEGFEVVSVASGTEALSVLESGEDFDAVVLDLAMPVMDGLTTAKQIRINESIEPHRNPVRIAFLTAHYVNDAIERVKEREDVEKIFIKSDPANLPAKLKEWLNA